MDLCRLRLSSRLSNHRPLTSKQLSRAAEVQGRRAARQLQDASPVLVVRKAGMLLLLRGRARLVVRSTTRVPHLRSSAVRVRLVRLVGHRRRVPHLGRLCDPMTRRRRQQWPPKPTRLHRLLCLPPARSTRTMTRELRTPYSASQVQLPPPQLCLPVLLKLQPQRHRQLLRLRRHPRVRMELLGAQAMRWMRTLRLDHLSLREHPPPRPQDLYWASDRLRPVMLTRRRRVERLLPPLMVLMELQLKRSRRQTQR